jgi:hypothetical protein
MDAPEPTELVYPPPPSWAPAFTAAGLAGLVAGLFTWWPYALIGAFVVLLAARSWLRGSWRELVSLPRRQRTATAPIPLTVAPPPDRAE